MAGEATREIAPDDAGKRLISLVIPVYNEVANIERAYVELLAVFETLPRYALEFVFTDNHSDDGTFPLLATLAAADSRIKVLRFNRNYGFQRSLLTAYRHALGDAAVQIDCDLQDPPALIAQFITLWEQGHDVVVGIRRRRREHPLLALGRRIFYAVLSKTSDDRITRDAGDFRLIDRSVVNMLKELNDINPYVRGVVSSFASNEAGIVYDRNARLRGKSKFPLAKLFRFAVDGIISHSVMPLRLASYIGLLVSTITFFMSIGYLSAALFFGRSWPSGFATIVIITLFGISLNAIFLGIIGEYVSRIYQQVRYRPLVVVERAINIVRKAEGK
jgi:glycosyltransferase involved in cell wall biosynthesis